MTIHELPGDRLDDEVDVTGNTARVRPQTHVDLLRLQQVRDNRSRPLE